MGGGIDGMLHITVGRQLQLELRQSLLECQCQFGRESERVEQGQPGYLPLLSSFFRFYRGSFANNALFPAADYFA